MKRSLRNFGKEKIDLMGRVCNEAWSEVQTITFYLSPKDSDEMLRQMIVRVMAAVAAGERDAARLKVVALDGIEA
jgi:hypothetical protein